MLTNSTVELQFQPSPRNASFLFWDLENGRSEFIAFRKPEIAHFGTI